MLNGANTMRSLLALGLLMTLCAPASAASSVRTHFAGHSKHYGQYNGGYGQYNSGFSQYNGGYDRYNGGAYSQYYGSPNNRGGLVGGSDSGT
jgi:opacity protein-like surface antigen